MRELGNIDHPEMKITIYQWNNKFILKFERGHLEQTFKVSEFDIASESEARAIITKTFTDKVMTRFNEMAHDWSATIDGIG